MEGPRNTNEEINLDVDWMILDYMLCNALKAIIHERVAQRSKQHETTRPDCESLLGTFEVFFSLFQSNHPQAAADAPRDIKVKLQMLTFANLFLRRYKRSAYLPSRETLDAQRKCNSERARRWWRRERRASTNTNIDDISPLTRQRLRDEGRRLCESNSSSSHRRDMLAHLGLDEDEADVDTVPDIESTPSLLDTLPEYMALCALVSPDKNAINQWMKNALLLMLHSGIEQILVYGRMELDALEECFAWDPSVEYDEEEESAWTTMRDEMRNALMPCEGVPWADQLRALSFKHPFFDIEGFTLELLTELLEMLETPVLMQLEGGKLDGLTVSQTNEFKERVGIR